MCVGTVARCLIHVAEHPANGRCAYYACYRFVEANRVGEGFAHGALPSICGERQDGCGNNPLDMAPNHGSRQSS
jgi:hypothetical protein